MLGCAAEHSAPPELPDQDHESILVCGSKRGRRSSVRPAPECQERTVFHRCEPTAEKRLRVSTDSIRKKLPELLLAVQDQHFAVQEESRRT